jgi:hypothetical protein
LLMTTSKIKYLKSYLLERILLRTEKEIKNMHQQQNKTLPLLKLQKPRTADEVVFFKKLH